MPAFRDEFTFFCECAATVFERDPYTWSGVVKPSDDNGEVAIGGMYMAAFIYFGSQEWIWPDGYGEGLRSVSVKLRTRTRCDYNQSPGYELSLIHI